MQKTEKIGDKQAVNSQGLTNNQFISEDGMGRFAEELINSLREPILLLNKDLIVVNANRSYYELFKVGSDQTIGVNLYELGLRQWVIPELNTHLTTLLSRKIPFSNIKVEKEFPDIGKRILLLNGKIVERATGKQLMILLEIVDITEQRWTEINLDVEKIQIEAQNKEIIQIGKELAFQKQEKKKRVEERIVAQKELHFQNREKGKREDELIVANIELAFQNREKEKRAAELILANEELAFQNKEKEKRAAELIVANRELVFQNREKEKRADELFLANKELDFQSEEKEKRSKELMLANVVLAFQNDEKEKRAAELILANKELAFQNDEKEKRAAELILANKELSFQNREKEKRTDELFLANKELDYQNEEKEKRATELILANKELAFQNQEKEKRAAELILANKELAFQNEEKEKRAAELIIANKELIFQNREKERRADELLIANKELDFQNEEKEKRASELILANKELAFQNDEKEKRAAELIIANKELLFQNSEKEKRADELLIANRELDFQSEEKEKRAAELIIANKELVYQNEEKEKRANELLIANKELMYQNEEKEKRSVELILAKERAEGMSRLKTNFLNNMSHELRTPLNGIMGFAEILGSSLIEPDFIEMSQNIFQSGRRLSETLNFILDLSNSETDNFKMTAVDSAIVPLAKISIESFAKAAINKNLQLETIISADNIYVHLEERLLSRILYNLLDNALKFTEHGKIVIEIGKEIDEEKDWVYIKISDTGIGIASDKLDIIWEEFRQASEGLSRSHEGAGLGLTISKRATELMQGKIMVESILGVGSTFTVKFPAVNVVPQVKLFEDQFHKSIPPHKNEKLHKFILPLALYVEDDYSNRYIVKLFLRDIFSLETADDGEKGLELASEKKYEFILMDINLGNGLNGIETMHAIRKISGYSTIPIIAITAYVLTGDRENLINAGFDGYIGKPFSRQMLIDLIKTKIEY